MFAIKVVEKIVTQFIFSKFFFLENLAFYEIIWKNMVGEERSQMII